MIEVKIVSDLTEFQGLSNEWNDLLENRSSEDTVFLRHEWFQCWWESFAGDSRLYVIVAKDNEKIIGIAPFMIRKVLWRGLPIKLIGFIENGNSLHNDFIILETRQKDVFSAMLDYLFQRGKDWDMLEIKNIPGESSNVAALRDVLRSQYILFNEKVEMSSPYLKINSDWKSFLNNRSSKIRKTLRNIQNRFNRLGDYSIQRIDDVNEYENIKSQLYDIAKNSWTEKVGDSLNSMANRRFFDGLSHIAAVQSGLVVWLLRIAGEPVAFEYHLKYNGRIHGLRASYKQVHRSISPGAFLDYHIIKSYFENNDGVNEYNMGGDVDFYKMKWTKEGRNYLTLHIFKHSAYSRLINLYEYKIISVIKRIVRKSEQ